jgi:hypothetical protein
VTVDPTSSVINKNGKTTSEKKCACRFWSLSACAACVRACVRARVHACVRSCVRARACVYVCTCVRACLRALQAKHAPSLSFGVTIAKLLLRSHHIYLLRSNRNVEGQRRAFTPLSLVHSAGSCNGRSAEHR